MIVSLVVVKDHRHDDKYLMRAFCAINEFRAEITVHGDGRESRQLAALSSTRYKSAEL